MNFLLISFLHSGVVDVVVGVVGGHHKGLLVDLLLALWFGVLQFGSVQFSLVQFSLV